MAQPCDCVDDVRVLTRIADVAHVRDVDIHVRFIACIAAQITEALEEFAELPGVACQNVDCPRHEVWPEEVLGTAWRYALYTHCLLDELASDRTSNESFIKDVRYGDTFDAIDIMLESVSARALQAVREAVAELQPAIPPASRFKEYVQGFFSFVDLTPTENEMIRSNTCTCYTETNREIDGFFRKIKSWS
jgi:hypothetical protein